MPLNRLSSNEPSYVESSDAIPMISRLNFDQRYRRAFVQIFGKTVIVRNITIGTDYARKHNLSVITLDGNGFKVQEMIFIRMNTVFGCR